ncbi:hypothetical protein MesoLj131a_30410 [Mesorhizobium sp. 131-2-1]|nr:hypothetical protein MesoLj131a_30410 [Mesorhizobium sp. 131-2-1]
MVCGGKTWLPKPCECSFGNTRKLFVHQIVHPESAVYSVVKTLLSDDPTGGRKCSLLVQLSSRLRQPENKGYPAQYVDYPFLPPKIMMKGTAIQGPWIFDAKLPLDVSDEIGLLIWA